MYKFTVLRKSNGEVMVIDNVRLRLSHLRRRVYAWANVTKSLVGQLGVQMTMYGLTYDTQGTLVKASDWEVGDIREFMYCLRARMGKRLLAYAWVAERQARGTMHYHVAIVHTGFAPKPDISYMRRNERGELRSYERMWMKGNSHTDYKMRSPFYLVSYLKKEYQKDFEHFPIGAHAWAVWVSDAALQASLRMQSLGEYKQKILCEVMIDNEGLGFEECWELMEWEVKRNRLIQKWKGESWEYFGQVQSAADLARWGVTDDLLKQHIFTRFQSHKMFDPA